MAMATRRSILMTTMVLLVQVLFGTIAIRVATATHGVESPGGQTYTVDTTFTPGAKKTATLTGTETIRFTNTRPTTMTTAYLRLWPNGQTAVCGPCIRVTMTAGGSAGKPQQNDTVVPVTLTTPLASGQTGQISFTFTESVPNYNFRYGYSGGAAMLGGALPVLAITDDGGTHLEPYSMNGEAFYGINAAWNVKLTLPSDHNAATTGTVTSTTTLSGSRKQLAISAPSARDFAMAVGPYTVSQITTSGVTVRFFKQNSTRTSTTKVLGWAKEAVDSLTADYGALGFTELDLAEAQFKPSNGLEWPQMVMVSPDRDIVFHEVAHQWWHTTVGNNQALEPWLDESFAEFSNERMQGTLDRCTDGDPMKPASGNSRLNATQAELDAAGNYISTIYSGGPCVLEQLRRDWGDARFDSFMRGLVTAHRDGIETTSDVIAAIRSNAPAGYDVDHFLTISRLPLA